VYDVPEAARWRDCSACCRGVSGRGDLGSGLRAKYLLNSLRLNQSLLVLDDFHNGDRASFTPLLRAAAFQGNPGHLLLVSRSVLGLPDAPSSRSARGRTPRSRKLLRELDMPALPGSLVRLLVARTGGLPLAVKFFSVLVVGFGRDPNRLLEGELAQTPSDRELVRRDQATGSRSTELTLLRYFSLAQRTSPRPGCRGAPRRPCRSTSVAGP